MLYIHLGLHKTGTTSIQSVCKSQCALLAEKGILYPLDESLTYGTAMHLGLSQIDVANLPTLIRPDWFTGGRHVLLSNEELGQHFSKSPRNELISSLDYINNNISPIVFVVSIRNDRKLLASACREYIQGTTFPANGVGAFLNNYYTGITKIAEIVKPYKKCVVSLDDAGGSNWVNHFLSRIFHLEFDFQDTTSNSSVNKNLAIYLSGFFRSYYTASLGLPSYSQKINRLVSQAVAAIQLDSDFSDLFEPEFFEYIDNAVECFVKREDYNRLCDLFEKGADNA
ncbi:MAG: hypothetical protein QNK24_03915 [Desulfuromusa sp.]|nr:hypothetical protein [Desulfuromusa sp.]